MYEVADDPYCYPGTDILRNKRDLRSGEALAEFELAMVSQRAEEPLPNGRFGVAHYRAVHRHLFGDVYDWAGKTRRIRLQKGDSVFCYPENIDGELKKLFDGLKQANFLRDLAPEKFVKGAASFLTTLNAIHAFREGNGRTQLTFLALLASHAGEPLHLEDLREKDFLEAMIASFKGNEALLRAELLRMTI